MNRALIVRQPWIDRILDDGKVWEMRSRPTKIRGLIGLIEAASGLIVGEAYLGKSSDYKVPFARFLEAKHLHHIEEAKLREAYSKWPYAWRLYDAKRYEKPIPYNHPKGAVTWVRLDNLNTAA